MPIVRYYYNTTYWHRKSHTFTRDAMNMIIQIGMNIPKCVRVEAEVTQDPPHAFQPVAAEVPQNRFASSRMTRQFTHDNW